MGHSGDDSAIDRCNCVVSRLPFACSISRLRLTITLAVVSISNCVAPLLTRGGELPDVTPALAAELLDTDFATVSPSEIVDLLTEEMVESPALEMAQRLRLRAVRAGARYKLYQNH